YDLSLRLGADEVHGYFGMRKISVTQLPGSKIPYIALNNKPVYVQLALDQSYHPDGFYTFPSDAFMKDEIIRSKRIGLNGIRTHIKVDIPRKLYWADKLGLLVMSDVPNSWGEPDADMQQETEYTLREMLKRDFNHPAIFSWITFNETWGLFTHVDKKAIYTPETQKWVASVYRLAKSLDPTRLVEDNSVCCGRGHTETDIHSWHAYQAGYEWDKLMDDQSKNLFPGSQWNFEKGYVQGSQPMINSEFGNVWGYQGSTGDVDYTFDYHKAMNSFRNHPKMAGWLYTEHHDVINEWNGYYKFDRTEKETGLGAIVPGMTLKDLHGPFYLSTGQEITWAGKAGQTVKIPLHVSTMTDLSGSLRLKITFAGITAWGEKQTHWTKELPLQFKPWDVKALDSLNVVLPKDKSVNTLTFTLTDAKGNVVHRNFGHIIVEEGNTQPSNMQLQLISVPVERFSTAQFTEKQWSGVLGHKVNGAGAGYFEYEFPIAGSDIAEVRFMVEASSKPILGKDRSDAGKMDGDYMLGKGTFDPGVNPNAYPQTDVYASPANLRVSVNGMPVAESILADDPADHQGILSWHYQARNNKLDEAGTYGYLVQGVIPPAAWQAAVKAGKLVIRFESTRGGLALYGDQSGRYVTDPSILILRK
ncbi:MAG: glycoside hydrolase family 2 TIM barrel-domain containing protein, partial [Bacteroidota bacterium]